MNEDFHIRSLFTNKMYGQKYTFRCLTDNELFGLSQFEAKLRQKYRFEPMLTEDRAVFLLKNRHIFPFDGEKRIKKLFTLIEDTKVEIFQSYAFKSHLLPGLKNQLKKLNREYEDLQNKKHTLHKATYNGFIKLLMIQKQILLSSEIEDDKMHHSKINDIVQDYYNSIFDEKLTRLLAKISLWQNIWQSNKPTPFKIHTSNYNLNQDQIVNYSKFYDIVFESSNKPSDEIINDDNAIDGWFIYQARENKKKQIAGEIDTNTDHGASDVYVPVRNQKDANKIIGLNK